MLARLSQSRKKTRRTLDPTSAYSYHAALTQWRGFSMRLVIIESPYAGDTARNTAYARAAVRDSLLRGEAPIASHLLYTQPGVLDDNDPAERQHGIDAGLAWHMVAEATVVYADYGISRGMAYGIAKARRDDTPIEYRFLSGWPK